MYYVVVGQYLMGCVEWRRDWGTGSSTEELRHSEGIPPLPWTPPVSYELVGVLPPSKLPDSSSSESSSNLEWNWHFIVQMLQIQNRKSKIRSQPYYLGTLESKSECCLMSGFLFTVGSKDWCCMRELHSLTGVRDIATDSLDSVSMSNHDKSGH